MDPSAPDAPHAAHPHRGGRIHRHALPATLISAFLVLGACASFAVVMTNGDDGRAAARDNAGAPGAVTWSGEAQVPVDDGAGISATGSLSGTPLLFRASLPDGPVSLGAPGSLLVTIENPGERPLRVDSIAVTVRPPSVPGCLAEWLRVDDYPSSQAPAVTVPGGGSTAIRLDYRLVDLPDVNQDACKGVTFELTLAGAGDVL